MVISPFELLADINLDCDGHPSFAHSVLSHEDDAGNGCSKSDQFECSSVTPIKVVSDDDANIQASPPIAFLRRPRRLSFLILGQSFLAWLIRAPSPPPTNLEKEKVQYLSTSSDSNSDEGKGIIISFLFV
ncbi:hypothetical protein MUK42_05286 [Musa troglodytarum]|uniref:Uncharacterized protein n=1 Tax=Musa troglodytarum TaxID=320322 RepID=A0A9E7JGT0_9LILI|nr:hypothetical protein MUK42_05286 [Musa troglodytarum]